MFKKSFKGKIILPGAIVLVALVVTLTAFLFVRFTEFSDSLINEKLLANISSLEFYLNECKANSTTAVTSYTHDPDVIEAVRDRDRDELLRIFAPVMEWHRINFFTICDEEGIVLARADEPDIFGESIISQQNIQDAMEGKISTYYEEGSVVRVSIRTGAPVYDADGTLIGILSAGVRFDSDSGLTELKKLFNSEITVFLGETRIASTIFINGQSIVGTVIDPIIAEIVFNNKQEYIGNIDILGETYRGYFKPLLNARDEVFAAIFLGLPLAELNKESLIFIRNGIYIGLVGLAVSLALLFVIISSISKPLVSLSKNMANFADGNLDVDINISSEDEVGHLGMSLQKSVSVIKELFEDIETMIAEQNKGNTDYSIDTDSLPGDYKQFAKNISQLAGFAMRDPLTGMSNRRSFNNRLSLEWQRAIRERIPVSLLILDLDKFRIYNDLFGHQQGDVTLITVADVIVRSLNRTIDFAARWGGEEFVVLLPHTDLSGAMLVAERIRKNIEDTVIVCPDKRGEKITISIGVNTQTPVQNSSIDSFISIADSALYKAKETGRNKVCSYEDCL
jgi:diguanylate cyclase (GGDEF)-like protein